MLDVFAAVLASLFSVTAFAESPAPTELELWPNGAPGAVGQESVDKPTLTVFLPPEGKANGSAIVICPGGGYGHLAVGHEGKDVGAWLNSHGITAFMLKYRLAPRYRHPAPLQDAQRAIRTVRARAVEWKLDPQRIGILGFSAGGHLASTAGTHFDSGNAEAQDPIDKASCRPDLLILCYPVISLNSSFTHVGSRNNLLGMTPDAKLVENLSNEKQVTRETPPTFLFHTSADTGVPPENSVVFYMALRAKGVPGEMHIYEKGGHGVGLAANDPVLSTWPVRCAAWMDARGFLKAAAPPTK
ncbi:MAG: alpha/beta hydrolase [Planctomycetaceae bacterium]|nr:alpha/beta hydrolase [Planctomycetaceae bacterium]